MTSTQTIALLALVGIGGYLWLKKTSVNQQELNYLLTIPEFASIKDTVLSMNGDEIHTLYTLATWPADPSTGIKNPPTSLLQSAAQIFSKYGIVAT